nr:alpha-xylosidase [Actinomyces sp. UMB0138]
MNLFPPAPARPDAVVEGDTYRFTVLTSRLIRMEYSPTGTFADQASFMAINRDFPVPDFRVVRSGKGLEILTEAFHLRYSGGPFSPSSLSISLLGHTGTGWNTVWHYGDAQPTTQGDFLANLGGTARTLDEADGPVEIEPGLISPRGYAVIDDSDTPIVQGWPTAREEGAADLYYFGYGHAYQDALNAFFALSGKTPLIPRWALGNWWSRYHRYTDAEYLALMDRFAAEKLPFSVAVLDMDWHLTELEPKYGNGWTGYTFNKELFPDPAGFMRALHERNLRVSLNEHPADGVRAHEDAYPAFAAALGVSGGAPIPFDGASKDYLRAYLDLLLHPLEEQGVDFWWMDWQQGKHTSIAGLDPLWMLNHLTFTDNARTRADGKPRRPLAFSRYAGPGSHRYPVGFSGDTAVSWDSLAFQPYFTATAANIGYFFWSHDIGGHMFGVKDNELETRWVQLGVFSPILRLHSTNDPFNSKEPWRYGQVGERIQGDYLRLRHRLIPYLYTAAWQAHLHGVPLARPLYYEEPEIMDAYHSSGAFLFGADMLIAPITEPADRHTHLAKANTYLPEGEWVDFFLGTHYSGGGRRNFWRTLEHVPALVHAGAIIPLSEHLFEGGVPVDQSQAPTELTLAFAVPRTGQGTYCSTYVEDAPGSQDSPSPEPAQAKLRATWKWEGNNFCLHLQGEGDRLPKRVRLQLLGADAAGDAESLLELGEVDLGSLDRRLELPLTELDWQGRVFELIDQAEISYPLKSDLGRAANMGDDLALEALAGPSSLVGALREVLRNR